jgi:hypothetical protein
LSLHVQIRIEELQRGFPDVLVQLGLIHTRGIDAGVGIVVPAHLIALIVEDLVANLTGQHVELGTRNIFRGKPCQSPECLREPSQMPLSPDRRAQGLSALLSVVQINPSLNVVAIT